MKKIVPIYLLALLISIAICDDIKHNEPEGVYLAPRASNFVFFDNFNENTLDSIWAISKNPKFNGLWSWAEPPGIVAFPGDKGLLITEEAKHYAISSKFNKPIDNTEKDLIIQYEVKFETESGLSCGGAYLKVLDENYSNESFGNDSPYIIMFGPDKCGSSDKVHFIFRHMNPKSKVWEEKHLKTPPSIKNDQLTHLYSLIIRKDNSFEILIDTKSVRKGKLLEDFEPSVIPPKTIDDSTDKKPQDWVDNEMIDDPNSKKPEDWNEEEPLKIIDMGDKKPTTWLDNGPEKVPDPNSKKPEDWNDDEDGKWEPPLISNPDCEKFGCGEWKAREIPNPKYKGKWVPPKIKNPLYKGEWKPKQISNPNYFEDLHPSNFPKMAGIGLELWTMNKNVLFDNFIITHDENEAMEYAKKNIFIKK